jgi:uncharacterized protein DUF805
MADGIGIVPSDKDFSVHHLKLDSIERGFNALAFLAVFVSAEFLNRSFETVSEGLSYVFPSKDPFIYGPSGPIFTGSRFFLDPTGATIDALSIPLIVAVLVILYRARMRAVFPAMVVFAFAFSLMVFHWQKYWYWKTSFTESTPYSWIGYFLFLAILGYIDFLFIRASWEASQEYRYGSLLAASGGRLTVGRFFVLALGLPAICKWLPERQRYVAGALFIAATIAFCVFVANLWTQGLGFFPNLGHGLWYIHTCFAHRGSGCWGLLLFGIVYITGFTLLLITFALLFVAGFRFAARRFSRLSLEKLVSLDRRAPILFLRSFQDDQVRLRKPRLPFVQRVVSVGEPRPTLDHILLEQATPHGPVVAIGAPNSKPPFGAARKYVSDAEWRDVVADLCKRSAKIVITIDETEGVRWEIAHLLEQKYLDKTLFLIPPRLAGVEAAMRMLPYVLGGHKRHEIEQILRQDSANCIGWFWKSHDQFVILTTRNNSYLAYTLAARLFLEDEHNATGWGPAPFAARTDLSGATTQLERLLKSSPVGQPLGRRDYAVSALVLFLAIFLVAVLSTAFLNPSIASTITLLTEVIAYLLFIVQAIRRLSNAGFSQWWAAGMLIPIANVILAAVLLFLPSKR